MPQPHYFHLPQFFLVIPSVLKYFVEFISENPQRDIQTFLLTASAIGQLFKRGATISAAEGILLFFF
jgi:L-serine deaminase